MTDEITGAFEHLDTSALLTAARGALGAGQARLAIHLFSAAFELGLSQGPKPADDVVEGMRVAWNLACEMGDRATAESLFAELEPHNTPEQNSLGLLRLQGLRTGALEATVVDGDKPGPDAGSIAQALTEATEGLDFNQWIRSFRSALGLQAEEAPPGQDNGPGLLLLPPGAGQLARPSGPSGERSGPGLATGPSGPPPGELGPRREMGPGRGWRLDYSHITGYRQAMDQMREFGFYSRDEVEQHRFAERVASLHGVGRLSLSQPFLFSGPDLGDVNLFATATANEIGWPVMNIHVEVEERGNGTIKISGPFRHRFFGAPPDLSELQTPCTVLIQDIGALQQLFQADQRNPGREGPPSGGFGTGGQGPGSWEGGMRRSVRSEFGGYLRDLVSKPGVFLMATSLPDFQPDEGILDIIGGMQRITVEQPSPDERRAVWERIKLEHASMQGLDTEALVEYSAGLPRAALFDVTQQALDGAYRASLSSGRYRQVQLGDVLAAMVGHLEVGSESYRRVEDAAAIEFLHGLEEDDPA